MKGVGSGWSRCPPEPDSLWREVVPFRDWLKLTANLAGSLCRAFEMKLPQNN